MSNLKKYHHLFELMLLVLLLIGILTITIQSGMIDHLKQETKSEKIIMFIGIFVVMHIVLLIHELGHLIAGLVQGFRFELLVVGLLGIKREDDQIKFYLNKNLGLYGGLAATSPSDDDPSNLKKYAKVVLAGPIASLLFAMLCFGLVYILPDTYALQAYVSAITSIGIFLATTIPSKTGMFFTDRKNISDLRLQEKRKK